MELREVRGFLISFQGSIFYIFYDTHVTHQPTKGQLLAILQSHQEAGVSALRSAVMSVFRMCFSTQHTSNYMHSQRSAGVQVALEE